MNYATWCPNINVIDIHSLLFVKEKDPISLFAEKIYGHYSADTYFKIAKIIKNYLDSPWYKKLKGYINCY